MNLEPICLGINIFIIIMLKIMMIIIIMKTWCPWEKKYADSESAEKIKYALKFTFISDWKNDPLMRKMI